MREIVGLKDIAADIGLSLQYLRRKLRGMDVPRHLGFRLGGTGKWRFWRDSVPELVEWMAGSRARGRPKREAQGVAHFVLDE